MKLNISKRLLWGKENTTDKDFTTQQTTPNKHQKKVYANSNLLWKNDVFGTHGHKRQQKRKYSKQKDTSETLKKVCPGTGGQTHSGEQTNKGTKTPKTTDMATRTNSQKGKRGKGKGGERCKGNRRKKHN